VFIVQAINMSDTRNERYQRHLRDAPCEGDVPCDRYVQYTGKIYSRARKQKSFVGKPRTVDQWYEMSVDELQQCISRLPGKPVLMEHKNIHVGKVETAWLTPDGDCMAVITIDTATPAGKAAAFGIGTNVMKGLSLKHRPDTLDPSEVSICFEGARANTGVTGKIVSHVDEQFKTIANAETTDASYITKDAETKEQGGFIYGFVEASDFKRTAMATMLDSGMGLGSALPNTSSMVSAVVGNQGYPSFNNQPQQQQQQQQQPQQQYQFPHMQPPQQPQQQQQQQQQQPPPPPKQDNQNQNQQQQQQQQPPPENNQTSEVDNRITPAEAVNRSHDLLATLAKREDVPKDVPIRTAHAMNNLIAAVARTSKEATELRRQNQELKQEAEQIKQKLESETSRFNSRYLQDREAIKGFFRGFMSESLVEKNMKVLDANPQHPMVEVAASMAYGARNVPANIANNNNNNQPNDFQRVLDKIKENARYLSDDAFSVAPQPPPVAAAYPVYPPAYPEVAASRDMAPAVNSFQQLGFQPMSRPASDPVRALSDQINNAFSSMADPMSMPVTSLPAQRYRP
jgi:hypothetical protein